MAAYVDIANLAASKIGEDDQLRSPDDDTHLGRTVKAAWNLVRRPTLRAHSWNFAMKRAALAALSGPALVGGGYAFQKPIDCVRIVDLIDYPDRTDFQIEGDRILFDDAGPLAIRYIRDVPSCADWDDLFVEAFACRLAYQIADRITGDPKRKADAWDAFRQAVAEAKRVDAREGPRIENDAPGDWEIAQMGWGADAGIEARRWRGSATYP